MSEPESIASRASENNVPPRTPDEVPPTGPARSVPEREGLPRNYKMRADAHYVDQLESPAQPVIRMVPAAQIDCKDLPAAEGLQPLVASITAHGMLQPLIIRRHSGRFTLIAGRRRLAAAHAAGLATVPCVLHDVDSAAAAALAAAENLRARGDASPADAVDTDGMRPLLQELSADLAAIRTSITLLRGSPKAGLQQQVGANLIEAQAGRAAWMVGGMLGTFESGRLAPLAAIVQHVASGFEAYGRLAGLELDVSVAAAAAGWKLPEEAATSVIRGAVFATLSWLDGVSQPRVEVHAEALQGKTLRIEVVQRSVRVPKHVSLMLADPDPGSPPELVSALALRLARTVAAPYGGGAELTPLPGVGSVLQITFGSAHATA